MRIDEVAHALGRDWQSGQALAARFGVTRAALWKSIERLRAMGLVIEASRTHGYRLAQPPDWLDVGQIRSSLRPFPACPRVELEMAFEIDSTNSALLRDATPATAPKVLLAEFQSAGRGRRGRHWRSPLGANLYLSLRWSSDRGIAGLGGLSLVTGLAITRALRPFGIAIRLKWPNDLWIGQDKLGGILIEASGEHAGPCRVVIGIGLNVRMPVDAAQDIDQPWTDLARAGAAPLDRSRIAAALIGELLAALQRFEVDGLAPFLPDWEIHDALRDLPLSVHLGEQHIDGVGAGIDRLGQLQLCTDDGMRVFASGEVSVRPRRVHP